MNGADIKQSSATAAHNTAGGKERYCSLVHGIV